jgi:hypothetical protein
LQRDVLSYSMHRHRYIEQEGIMCAVRIRKFLKAVGAVSGLLALAILGVASATRVIAGNLTLDVGIDFAPKALPRTRDAPIKVWGYEKLRTRDGSVPPPSTHVKVEFDKYGHVDTRGLPACPKQRLVATTTEQARKLCPGAIVGGGFGAGVISLPEQAPISASSPITFFNGPEISGDPSVIVHAHLDVPAPTTYLIVFRIERIHKGSFGYRIESDIPKIAGGYGSVTDFRFRLDRRWRFRGRELSFLNARCAVPNRLRIVGRDETRYADGTILSGSLFARCHLRRPIRAGSSRMDTG